ncbi:YeeE/YedE thiosulfate transporter family protein [Thermohalobacter berrensis]|uniref:Transporter n=1 Tax=Thermohalobacter berrensis TaxID=99594 RepID=A0A419SUY1_9FIRM|nr:YeeE/YedE thiosulfate transporter family protein [Thermohalobacter berrensis]RKD29030.1 transporter [Thermohalobacter berrensis]
MSSKIEELKKRRKKEFKKKKNQTHYGLILMVLALGIYFFLLVKGISYSSFWIIGLFIGFVLQKSRFCFTSSFRDFIMVGNTALFKAIIIAFMISTIGFAIVQYMNIDDIQNFSIENVVGKIHPVGIHTIIGALMSGIGMVIAGSCASGTLMRIGEGFLLQILVLVGFIIGTLLGANQFQFWDKLLIAQSPTIYFPQHIGFVKSVIIQLIVLAGLYILADWYDKKNNIMSM